MNIDRSLITGGEQEQRAALRQALLSYGRVLGWPTHTTITFTEGLMRRPWKHGTSVQLSAAVGELRSILLAFEVRRDLAALIVELTMHVEEGGGRAARH